MDIERNNKQIDRTSELGPPSEKLFWNLLLSLSADYLVPGSSFVAEPLLSCEI